MHKSYWPVLLIVDILFAMAIAGCASSPSSPAGSGTGPDTVPVTHTVLSGKTDSDSSGTVDSASIKDTGGTVLAVPTRDQLGKNVIDANVLASLELGSPSGITQAVALVNQDSRGMTDRNRITLAVAAELMKILYPLEKVTWSIPSVPETDPYIGAIRSARLGIYDYNTGNSDFLSLVLPSLVLVTGSSTSGDYTDDAEKALQKASSMNPRSVLPVRLLSLLAARRGKQTEADAFNRKAWELDSSCYPAGVDWCRALIKNGDGQGAFSIGKILIARYPDSTEIRHLVAEAAFSTRDWSLADKYVLDVLRAEPDNTDFLLKRVRILVERKDYLKASSLLDAFATTNRTNRDYLLLRARVAREWNKNPATASSLLQEAQRLYPDDPEVLLSSAEVCYQTNTTLNGLTGREFVNRVLAKEPSNAVALALLVKDYCDSLEWSSAVKTGESLVAVYPTTENRVLLLRAILGSAERSPAERGATERGATERGATERAKALALAKSLYAASDPSDEVTSLYLDALIASGETTAVRELIAARMDGATAKLKGILYYYESKTAATPDAKLSSLRSSLLSDSRNASSLFAMYELYMDKKDYRMAQYYLKQVIAIDPANARYLKLQTTLDDLLAR